MKTEKMYCAAPDCDFDGNGKRGMSCPECGDWCVFPKPPPAPSFAPGDWVTVEPWEGNKGGCRWIGPKARVADTPHEIDSFDCDGDALIGLGEGADFFLGAFPLSQLRPAEKPGEEETYNLDLSGVYKAHEKREAVEKPGRLASLLNLAIKDSDSGYKDEKPLPKDIRGEWKAAPKPPLGPRYQYTTSGRVKLGDGFEFDIPEPGEGWEECSVMNVSVLESIPSHHEGLLIWREYRARMGTQQAEYRWKRWRRIDPSTIPPEFYPQATSLLSQTLSPPEMWEVREDDRWPVRRPSGVVKVRS